MAGLKRSFFFKNFDKIHPIIGLILAAIATAVSVIGLIWQMRTNSESSPGNSQTLYGSISKSSAQNDPKSFQFTMNSQLPIVSEAWLCSGKLIVPGTWTLIGEKSYAVTFSHKEGFGMWTVRLNHANNTTTSFDVDLYGNKMTNFEILQGSVVCG